MNKFKWALKPDIMAYELAKILGCVTNMQLSPPMVEALPPEALRHLSRLCGKCGGEITDHEDDTRDQCRWCNEGWKPMPEGINVAQGAQ